MAAVMDETEKPERNGRFFRGMLAGVFCTLFLLTAAGYYLLNVHGFSIFLDEEKLASTVRTKVQARAEQELPVILAKLTGDAGSIMLAKAESPNLTLEIGQKKVVLPPETMALLKEQFQAAASATLKDTVAGFDTAPYAGELAETAAQMVQETLAQEIYGRTFRFQANKWLSVPVTVQGVKP